MSSGIVSVFYLSGVCFKKPRGMFNKFTIHQISTALAVLFFFIFIIYNMYMYEPVILTDAIIIGLTAGMLPVAFVLIIFPFSEKIKLDELKRLSLQIAIGGLVLLYIYGKTIFEIFSS